MIVALDTVEDLRGAAGHCHAAAVLIDMALDEGDTPAGTDYLRRALAMLKPILHLVPPDLRQLLAETFR